MPSTALRPDTLAMPRRGRRSGGPSRKPDLRPRTLTHTAADPTPDQMVEWIDGQVNWPNLANDPEVAERARDFVVAHKTNFINQTSRIRDKWALLDASLRGESLSPRFRGLNAVRSGELYKAVETIVPRVEEALLAYDPWFSVSPRKPDKSKRKAALVREAWHRYLLHQAKFDAVVQPALRCAVTYGFFALKTWWDVRYRKQVVRNRTEQPSRRGLPSSRSKPEFKDVLVYEGLSFRLVDPYRFFVDITNADPQRGLYVGDVCDMTKGQIRALGRMWGFENLEALDELRGGMKSATDIGTDHYRAMRRGDATGLGNALGMTKGKGEPEVHEVTDFYCLWSPNDEEEEQEWVITLVDNNVVLRVQRNFHDDQHRPYAVARTAREGFDFFNVGPLDHALWMEKALNESLNLALKGHYLAVCPIAFAPPGSNLPESLWNEEPGQTFEAEGIQWFAPPSTMDKQMVASQVFRTNIEELSGAPRIWEGSAGSVEGGTATEVERKIQEANRRLKGLVRSVADGFRQLLEHGDALSSQFLTRRKGFKVLGKVGSTLGTYSELGPEDFGDPVDFTFIGLDRLQNLGLRGTQLMSWAQLNGPLFETMHARGTFSPEEFGKESWRAIVGDDLDNKVIKAPQPLEDMMSQEEENLALLGGNEVPVHQADDDADHIREILAVFGVSEPRELETNAKYLGLAPDVRRVFTVHLGAHINAIKMKQVAAAAAGKQNPAFNNAQPQQAEASMQEERPVGGKGRNGRTPDLLGETTQQTPPGETPGPPRAQSMAMPDRAPPVSQTANRR